MAPSTTKGRPNQGLQKPLVQPALPSLPFSKTNNTKPKPQPQPETAFEGHAVTLSRDSQDLPILAEGWPGHSAGSRRTDKPEQILPNGDSAPVEALTPARAEPERPGTPQELEASIDSASSAEPPIIEFSMVEAEGHAVTDQNQRLEVSLYAQSPNSSAPEATESSYLQENGDNPESLPIIANVDEGSQPTSTDSSRGTSEKEYVNGVSSTEESTQTEDIATGKSVYPEGVSTNEIEANHDYNQAKDSHGTGLEQSTTSYPASVSHPANSLTQRSRTASMTLPPMLSVSDHLLQLAASKMWADWVLNVHTTGTQPFPAYAHGLVLMRSARLMDLMNRQAPSQYSTNMLNVYPPRAILPHAFEAALRFFYSDTVLSRDALFPKDAGSDPRTMRMNLLDYLLSYWVAGIEMGIEPIVTRSAQLMSSFIDWDVTETIMREAIELDAISWRSGDHRADLALEYAAMALELKQTVLTFLATRMSPSNFKPDVGAATSVIKPRFSRIVDTRHQNPALATMVFGSMPSSADLSPSSPRSEILPAIGSLQEQASSNILANIDFDDLVRFYAQAKTKNEDVAAELVGRIVEERESRRQKVISNSSIPNKQRMATSEIWDIAGYREFMDKDKLVRERVGFLLPTKSR